MDWYSRLYHVENDFMDVDIMAFNTGGQVSLVYPFKDGLKRVSMKSSVFQGVNLSDPREVRKHAEEDVKTLDDVDVVKILGGPEVFTYVLSNGEDVVIDTSEMVVRWRGVVGNQLKDILLNYTTFENLMMSAVKRVGDDKVVEIDGFIYSPRGFVHKDTKNRNALDYVLGDTDEYGGERGIFLKEVNGTIVTGGARWYLFSVPYPEVVFVGENKFWKREAGYRKRNLVITQGNTIEINRNGMIYYPFDKPIRKYIIDALAYRYIQSSDVFPGVDGIKEVKNVEGSVYLFTTRGRARIRSGVRFMAYGVEYSNMIIDGKLGKFVVAWNGRSSCLKSFAKVPPLEYRKMYVEDGEIKVLGREIMLGIRGDYVTVVYKGARRTLKRWNFEKLLEQTHRIDDIGKIMLLV